MVNFLNFLATAKHKTATPILVAIIFIALFLPAASAQEADNGEPENNCITCHLEMDDVLKEVVFDWEKSVHAQAGVMCQDCHGGDAVDPDMAMEEEAGFKPKPEPHEIPAFCAKCHGDARKMRAYNLPSDQFEKFSKSVHGQKLLVENDPDAPDCTSCHGKHKILRAADPKSTVHRNNILKTCASCHSKKEMMEKRGLPFNQYELYKTSVHGKPFFEKGDLGVPTCFDCHSNHEIQKPQTPRVQLVCAGCHVEQEEMYKKSAHWDAAQQSGEPFCSDCHSNHGIQKPDEKKFLTKGDLNCQGCHQKNSVQMETATSLFKLLKLAKINVKNIGEMIENISSTEGSGFETSHLAIKNKKAEKLLNDMAIETHTLRIKGVRKKAKKIKKIKEAVTEETEAMWSELRMRKNGLIITWVVFFVFSWILVKRTKYFTKD